MSFVYFQAMHHSIKDNVIFDENVFPFRDFSDGFLLTAIANFATRSQTMPTIPLVASQVPIAPAPQVPASIPTQVPAPVAISVLASVATPISTPLPSLVPVSRTTKRVAQAPSMTNSTVGLLPPPTNALPLVTIQLPRNTHNMSTKAKAGIRKPKLYTASLKPTFVQ